MLSSSFSLSPYNISLLAHYYLVDIAFSIDYSLLNCLSGVGNIFNRGMLGLDAQPSPTADLFNKLFVSISISELST